MEIGERQIQRVGASAAAWQRRESLPGGCDAKKTLYISADATGVPMRREEVASRAGKSPEGETKTRMVHLACVFTQHTEDEEGRPLRDYDSTADL